MLYTVMSRHGCAHFLVWDDAVGYAAHWSELMQGKFAVYENEEMITRYENGQEIGVR